MSERINREIEEILEQSAEVLTSQSGKAREGGRSFRWSRPGWTRLGRSFSPGRVFLASVALLMTALILNIAGLGPVGLIFWLGLILFIVAYALFFVRSNSTPELRWRGKPVDYGRPPTLWARVSRWLRS